MSQLADSYYLNLLIDDAGVPEVAATIAEALAHPPWPPVSGWRTPIDPKQGPQRTDSLLEAARGERLERTVEWQQGPLIGGHVQPMDGAVFATLSVRDTAEEQAWRWLKAMEEVVERVLAAGVAVRMGKVARQGSGVVCVPRLPLVDTATYIVVASEETLDWAYEDGAAMIEAGAWEAREIEGIWRLSRAMHAETNVELLEAIQDGQWAMARLARPGKTRYDFQPPRAEEREIFHDGERRVFAVGYEEETQTAIYSCALEEDQHVQPWEIWNLGTALRDRKLPSGEAVKAIRVVFSDRASALRERRPLMDVGVTVQCYDEGGEMITLPKER